MSAAEVLSLFIICATVVSSIGIIAYGAWAILTNKTFLVYVHDMFKGGE